MEKKMHIADISQSFPGHSSVCANYLSEPKKKKKNHLFDGKLSGPAPPFAFNTKKNKHILLENKLHRLIRSLAHTSFLKTKYDLQNVLGNRNQRA